MVILVVAAPLRAVNGASRAALRALTVGAPDPRSASVAAAPVGGRLA